MERVVEPQLMDNVSQPTVYARANFDEPNSDFVRRFLERFGNQSPASILDLGCGPGDICTRLAEALPAARVYGLDGSKAMLDCARDLVGRRPGIADRVELILSLIPAVPDTLPLASYDAVVSNSLLHHLHEPACLWQTVHELGTGGAPVLVMDLKRPASVNDAARLVEQYAAEEPQVLKDDFFNSLLAAFTPGEVAAQLELAGLPLLVEVISDRHLLVSGRLPR